MCSSHANVVARAFNAELVVEAYTGRGVCRQSGGAAETDYAIPKYPFHFILFLSKN